MAAPPSTVTVGTYPPTRCGLATFTESFRRAMRSARPTGRHAVIRLVGPNEPEGSDAAEVVARWPIDDRAAIPRIAEVANRADALVVQHEFGIFGGPDGIDVLDLIDAVDTPAVVVLHTVMRSPSSRQRMVVEQLCDRAAAVVTQTAAARARLVELHDVDATKIGVIPHGAVLNLTPHMVPPSTRPMVLTWGLLGPGKGIETAIASIGAVRALGIDARYVVAGETHPKVRSATGEQYRDSLADLARARGLVDYVTLDGTYRDWDALRALIRSCDVVLLPYDSLDQVTSGVLVEAIASGKPVVATAFPHAMELLSRGSGVVVAHRDPDAMAAGLARVLSSPDTSLAMQRTARRQAAALDWNVVGRQYAELVDWAVTRRVAVRVAS